MPAHNAEKYLESCLESIIRQDHQDWELIAVDDGSEDRTLEILNQFKEKESRIKCISQDKAGIIPALQMAYSKTKGKFICRMDADDVMPEQKFSSMLQAWTAVGKGHLITGKVSYFSEQPLGDGYLRYANWINNLVDSDVHYKQIYRECVIPSCAWLIHRTDFEKCGGFQSDIYPEDYDLCFRFYQHRIKVVPIDQILHFWRDHSLRSSRNDPNYLDNNFLNIKLRYFINIELNSKQKVTLWGAGKKGKEMAKLLLENNIEFDWLTNNARKAGKDIYGKTLKVIDLGTNEIVSQKIILAIAGPEDQAEVKTDLEKIGKKQGVDFFFFA